jgi:hypothetical protein
MAFVLSAFAIVLATGTIVAFGWTSSLLYRQTSIKELLALTTLWALVVAGWLQFVALASD